VYQASVSEVSPFLRFCDRGQVANVQFMLDIGAAGIHDRDSEGHGALERVRASPGFQRREPDFLKIERLLAPVLGAKLESDK